MGFEMTIISMDVPPDAMLAGTKLLATVGGVKLLTFSVALVVAPLPALVEVIAPVLLL